MPLFDPQRDDSARSQRQLTLFGLADAERSILRVARHRPPGAGDVCAGGVCDARTCVGGSEPGALCGPTAPCPEGECRDGLFDFSTRLNAGVGPIVLRSNTCFGGTNAGGHLS